MSFETNKSSSYTIDATTEKKKRGRELLADERSKTPKRAKIFNQIYTYADNSVMHLFVEFAWEPAYGKFSMDSTVQFLRWLVHNVDSDINELENDSSIFGKLAHTLRFVLPILKESNGDAKYKNEHDQTVLHVFLNHYMWCLQPRLQTDLKLNKLVAGLIAKGVSVNDVDKFGNTPFSIAAMGLRRDLCWLMIDYFVKVDVRDGKGETVLHEIAGNRSLPNAWGDVVQKLLNEKGADPNLKNEEGMSPVHLAAKTGKDRILQILANNKADFALRTGKDETNLLLYCRNARDDLSVDVVELMLTDDCDVDLPDEFGYSAMQYATKHGANAVVDRLGKFKAKRSMVYTLDMSVTMMSASYTTDDESFSESVGDDVSVEFSG